MRHTSEQYMKQCGCRSVGECTHNQFAEFEAIDACVDDFAASMKRKLHRKILEGKSGWDDPEWPIENVIAGLEKHIEKGDMVDVANFAMFAWNKKKEPE